MLLHGMYVYSTNPLVVSASESLIPRLLDILPDEILAKSYFLIFQTWTKEPIKELLITRWRLRNLPVDRAYFMCSTLKETQRLGLLGFKTIWCHHNLFCNEEEFVCADNSDRPFDAVYNAVIAPYKRHYLLSGLEGLRLVTGSVKKLSDLDKLGLKNYVVNDRYLDKSEISDVYSLCKCGLALSAKEGGMLASTEYMLTGLPVVSTPSIGGRDVYYDEGNHILCDASPMGVKTAIEEAKNRQWDRQSIRNNAIKKSAEFRSRLCSVVEQLSGVAPFDVDEITGSWFKSRFLSIHFMDEFIASYNGTDFEKKYLVGRVA